MKKNKFYRDIKIVVLCKKCGAPFRPVRGYVHHGLCITHRREFLRFIRPSWKFTVSRMTPEKRQEFMEKEYFRWQKWVNDNLERRRRLALESYHRHKNDPHNKKRSHHKKKPVV